MSKQIKRRFGVMAGIAGGVLGAAVLGGFGAPDAPVRVKPSAAELSSARERVIDMLMGMTKDENASIRANALEGLSASPARIEGVIRERLLDQNEGVRSVAAMVAGRLKLKGTIDALRSVANDYSPYARASAIYALRRCGVDEDPSPIAEMVLENPDPRVRSHAAFILGELGDTSALGLLRQASAESMPRANPSLVKLMKLQIAEAMIKLGDEGQLSVIRAALYPARAEELEATALAVQILGEVDDRGAVEQLIQLTKSREETERAMPAEVRLGAAAALAKLGQTRGAFIADEYRADSAAVLRAQAAAVYGETGRSEHLGVLETMLEDGSPLVRVSAASAVLRVSSRGGSRARAGESWRYDG